VGNTLRGAFGHVLHDNHRDVYDNMFKVESAESIPNPFVISAPYPAGGEYRAGALLDFCITLFGTACEFEPIVINAVESMSRGALADTKMIDCTTIYSREWSDAGAEFIPYCDKLTVKFISPAMILVQKQVAAQIDFAMFVDRILARISSIIDKYGENEFVIPYSLVASKPFVKAEYDLQAVKLQTSGQPVSGIVGSVRYFGDVTRYLPYIDICSQLHIGKKTTRSCGEFSFEI